LDRVFQRYTNVDISGRKRDGRVVVTVHNW
jgi:hypothetical protein